MMTPLLRITTALARAVGNEPVTPVDLQRMNQFATVAKKFVAATANKEALLAAWRELPAPLQQRTMKIAKEQGIVDWFGGLVGQVPEQLTGTAVFEPSPVVC
jgi:hypothetical protein